MADFLVNEEPQDIPGTNLVGYYRVRINAWENGPFVHVLFGKRDAEYDSTPVIVHSLPDRAGNDFILTWKRGEKPRISCDVPHTVYNISNEAGMSEGMSVEELEPIRGWQDVPVTILPNNSGKMPRLVNFSKSSNDIGQAILFNTFSSIAINESNPSYPILEIDGGKFSIECWLSPMSLNFSSFNIIQSGDGFEFGFALCQNNDLKESGHCLRVKIYEPSVEGEPPNPATYLMSSQLDRLDVPNKWCLCHFTFDGTFARLYYQGIMCAEKMTAVSGFVENQTVIGVAQPLPLQGGMNSIKMSQLVIYNRCLSDREILLRYNNGSGLKIDLEHESDFLTDGIGLTDAMEAFWSFDGTYTEEFKGLRCISAMPDFGTGHLTVYDQKKNGVSAYYFSPRSSQEIFFVCNLPHSWMRKTGIVAQVHWSTDHDGEINLQKIPVDNENRPVLDELGHPLLKDPTKPELGYREPAVQVHWALDYTITGVGRVFDNAPKTIYGLTHRCGPAAAKTHLMTPFEGRGGEPDPEEAWKNIEIDMSEYEDVVTQDKLKMTYSAAIVGRIYRLKDDSFPFGAHFFSLIFHINTSADPRESSNHESIEASTFNTSIPLIF